MHWPYGCMAWVNRTHWTLILLNICSWFTLCDWINPHSNGFLLFYFACFVRCLPHTFAQRHWNCFSAQIKRWSGTWKALLSQHARKHKVAKTIARTLEVRGHWTTWASHHTDLFTVCSHRVPVRTSRAQWTPSVTFNFQIFHHYGPNKSNGLSSSYITLFVGKKWEVRVGRTAKW